MISPVKIWRRQKVVRSLLNRQGTIVSWTNIFVPAGAFKTYAPYIIVLVELENGEKAVGQLVDNAGFEPHIGDKVMSLLRKVRSGAAEDVIAYGVKFKLL
jgi:uncharacterized OB-fold protein